MSTQQQTLDGDALEDHSRERPDTFVYCPDCDEWFFRSLQLVHEHETFDDPTEAYNEDNTSSSSSDDEEAETVDLDTSIDVKADETMGHVFSVELSYSVDFRFDIPACSEHQAKDRAQDLVNIGGNAVDAYQVHSRVNKGSTIYADDEGLPKSWDPYGGTPLWEVYGE